MTPTGAPDFTEVVWIMAQDAAGNLRPVAVDAAGQLVTVIKGTIDGIATPVSVDQVTKDREVKGTDGVALRTLAVDANGQLIMVPRGQTGNYMDVDAAGNLSTVIKGLEGANLRTVAVDATGNIIGVFKGEHAGALRTIATDADGRMLAVLTDPENIWGDRPIIGQAELAVRLGSPVAYEQRGSVIFKDSFEHGLTRFTASTLGAGSSVTLSSDFSAHRGFSAKLHTSTASFSRARIDTWLYNLHPLTPFGYEVSFFPQPWDWDRIEFIAWIDTGTRWLRLGVRIFRDPRRTEVHDAASWTLIPGSENRMELSRHLNTVKLIVNPATEKYLRLYQNADLFDLSAFTLPASAHIGPPRIYLEITNFGTTIRPSDIYIDNIILTTREPLT